MSGCFSADPSPPRGTPILASLSLWAQGSSGALGTLEAEGPRAVCTVAGPRLASLPPAIGAAHPGATSAFCLPPLSFQGRERTSLMAAGSLVCMLGRLPVPISPTVTMPCALGCCAGTECDACKRRVGHSLRPPSPYSLGRGLRSGGQQKGEAAQSGALCPDGFPCFWPFPGWKAWWHEHGASFVLR